MNPVIENIKNRRSVRKYKTEPLIKEHLDAILEAAAYAPSGHNDQPWHFTVIRNRALIDLLSSRTKEWMAKQPQDWMSAMGKNPEFHVFYNAPAVIAVSYRKDAVSPQADVCAAIQNMLLAAESLDIGSCWIGLARYVLKTPEGADLAARLQLPAGYEPDYFVTLGYKAAAHPKPLPRREGVVSYID
ncbi:MAG: nitroreductase family protein [Elusimicrobiales bacterium]